MEAPPAADDERELELDYLLSHQDELEDLLSRAADAVIRSRAPHPTRALLQAIGQVESTPGELETTDHIDLVCVEMAWRSSREKLERMLATPEWAFDLPRHLPSP